MWASINAQGSRSLARFTSLVRVAVVSVVVLQGSAHPAADQPAEPALFHRFDGASLNYSRIIYIIDTPGPNMPPGSLQVFVIGNPNPVVLRDEEADAFRAAIAGRTKDMTPRKTVVANEKPSAPATGSGKTRRRIVVGPENATPSTERSGAKTQEPKTAFDEG